MKSSDVWRNRSSSSRARRSPTCAAFSIRRQKVILLPRNRIADNEERPMNGSRLLLSSALLLVGGPAFAGQAPFATAAADFPVSGRDRVYAAEQFSNTISVIDPSTNTNLGVIRLGDPQPMNLSPLYKGQFRQRGLGYGPRRGLHRGARRQDLWRERPHHRSKRAGHDDLLSRWPLRLRVLQLYSGDRRHQHRDARDRRTREADLALLPQHC